LAIERTDADLMHLERRITALEGRSRNILLRLHDKIVGRGPLADRRAKDAHVVAAGNLPRFLGGEAAAQHRSDEMHPSRVVLDATPGVELVGSDADVIDPDDLGHFLEAVDIFVEARKEVPDADRAAGVGDRPSVIGADLPGLAAGSDPSPAIPRRPYATAAGVCSRL